MADIRFKDGQILFSGGRIAMGEACCCDYIPPDVCVDCGPPYVIGNTGNTLLTVDGFVDQEPLPICCDLGFFSSDPNPPVCDTGYQSFIYSYGSRLNSYYVLDKEGGACCWSQKFYTLPNPCTSGGGPSGPIVSYSECWDTRSEPDDHLWKIENRLSEARVCLFDGGDTIYWSPSISEICCMYKDGVIQGPTSSACDDMICWELDYPYFGSISKTDFCNNYPSTITGKQYRMSVSFSGYTGDPTSVNYVLSCSTEVISNVTFKLYGSDIFA